MARKSSEKHTKPVFGQSTKTSINLDSLGYLITLFIVGKTISFQKIAFEPLMQVTSILEYFGLHDYR